MFFEKNKTSEELQKEKKELIDYLIYAGYLKTPEIIRAFRKVPRECFIPPRVRNHAYANEPLVIGKGQTISQPLTVAAMTEALEPEKGQNILEIGSGSGYQAAILAEIVGDKGSVTTVERIPELYDFAKKNLRGYKNVHVILGDGSLGWPKAAPYDRIIVTAAAPDIPKPMVKQLKVYGIIVIPVGRFVQSLVKAVKTEKGMQKQGLGPFMFVLLRGEHGF
jgi:protein-L-isoaspartate(D-aspartate) O-methyltransferase